MVKTTTPTLQAARSAKALETRDFLWIVARDRTTGLPQNVGFWSGAGNVDANVKVPDTGLEVIRPFYGSGTLIQISAIPAVSNLTVQRITIRMNQIDDLVEQAIRLYDCQQARVEIYRGYCVPGTDTLVDPAECRFLGFCDEIEVHTAPEDEEGYAELTCTSNTQEMYRFNSDTRSHESQKLRSPTDNFFVDAGVVGEWESNWGKASGQVQTQKKQGLFGWGNFLGFL